MNIEKKAVKCTKRSFEIAKSIFEMKAMKTISAKKLREDILNVIEEVNESSTPVMITNGEGQSAVLIGEEDWKTMVERAGQSLSRNHL